MRARWIIAAVASGALAVGVLAPVGASAVPGPPKPSGQALVRIDGGTAQAVERGPLLYRIVLPPEATITWLGDSNRKLTIGTLGRKGLIAGWTKLGHSARGAHSLSTITWQEPGAEGPTFAGALVGMPKINADGLMTFLARTIEPLPEALTDFTLNISRPVIEPKGPTVRGSYPLAFPIYPTSNTVGVQPIATGDTTATFSFVTLSNGAVTGTCDKPTAKSLSSSADYVTFGGTCGDTTWSGGVLQFTPMQGGGTSAQIWLSVTMIVKSSTGTSTFSWNQNMAQWKSGPTVVWPV